MDHLSVYCVGDADLTTLSGGCFPTNSDRTAVEVSLSPYPHRNHATRRTIEIINVSLSSCMEGELAFQVSISRRSRSGGITLLSLSRQSYGECLVANCKLLCRVTSQIARRGRFSDADGDIVAPAPCGSIPMGGVHHSTFVSIEHTACCLSIRRSPHDILSCSQENQESRSFRSYVLNVLSQVIAA